MTRKKWPKQLINDVYYKETNPYGSGKCWHCGKKIVFTQRKHSDKYGWHIDHFPIVYRDIEDQLCCGVTDQHDINNLVPSCVSCNISHEFEVTHPYYCNKTQPYCKKKCFNKLLIVSIIGFLTLYSFSITILFIIYYTGLFC
tara:strand:+ start:2120 stop:2545 length:426 start_codon:yes stop_codon:yes gene_type:complete